MTLSGILNYSTVKSGITPSHGFTLSSFCLIRYMSTFMSWDKILAAYAPKGLLPTTAIYYFKFRTESESHVLYDTKEQQIEKDEKHFCL